MIYRDILIAKPKYQELTSQLFDLLDKQGVTRYKISKDTGIDQTRLSRVFNHKVPLSMNELIRICETYSMGIEIKKENLIKQNAKQMMNYLSKLIS